MTLSHLLAALAWLPIQDGVTSLTARESGWAHNLRWDIDLSVRAVATEDGDVQSLGSVGLDLHKVLAGPDGRDIGTIVFQPYFLSADPESLEPPLTQAGLQWRIVNINLRPFAGSRNKFRVGHFEVPFGLEQNLDTNGTLRSTPHRANFGFVTDWGLTTNGELEHLDYEFAWSRGSGNEYLDRGGDGLWSGRIGTPRESDMVVGASFVHGDLLSGSDTRPITRFALDATTYWHQFGFQGELSHGREDADTRSTRALLEANVTNPHETTLGWFQLLATDTRRDGSGGDDFVLESRLGVRWAVAPHITLSAQLAQPIDDGSLDLGTATTLQLRCRF